MLKRTSLKEIAQKVGVSTSLVSYVLNNKLEDRISKVTAEKIRGVAADLNYQPNQIAKSLKINKTQTIGLIVADISNPFSSTLARIIEDEAKKSKYSLIIGSADESCKKSQDLISLLLSRQVDGFIIAPPAGSENQLKELQQQNVPFVLIDRYFPGFNFNYIAIDNYKTSYNSITHLFRNGFKKIGMVNYKTELFHLNERTRGYAEALIENGLENEKYFKEINERNVETDVGKIIDELMDQSSPIDALFFATNTIAIEGLSYLRNKQISVPKDLGIICFDETAAYRLYECPLTYVKQPLINMGKESVQVLVEMIRTKTATKNILLDTELIVNRSSQFLE